MTKAQEIKLQIEMLDKKIEELENKREELLFELDKELEKIKDEWDINEVSLIKSRDSFMTMTNEQLIQIQRELFFQLGFKIDLYHFERIHEIVIVKHGDELKPENVVKVYSY